MRRKIMTAFVCAIMTISVIPVYADDTQTDQAVTTEVSTETAATVQETKRTQSKEQQKKKTTSKKHSNTMKIKKITADSLVLDNRGMEIRYAKQK